MFAHNRGVKIVAVATLLVAMAVACGNKPRHTPAPVATVDIPVRVNGVGEGGFAGMVAVPKDCVFDSLHADIKGFDWQVVGQTGARMVDGRIALELPETITDEDLCKVARDTYNDYEGWWPAADVSDKSAKVAGLGDILALRGEDVVGRIFLSDRDGRAGAAYIYFHYADRPFSLGGYNLHSPKESSSIRFDAVFTAGWNAYANVSSAYLATITTDIPSSLGWRFERWP